MSDDSLLAIVAVRCGQCVTSHGRGTMLGEMQLWPDHVDGGGWRWQRVARQKVYPDGRRERRIAGEPKRAGGLEAPCDRCGHRPRLRVAKLARRAASILDEETAAGASGNDLLNLSASRRGITV